MRLFASFLLAASLVLVCCVSDGRAEDAGLKYFVEVSVPTIDAAARLAVEGFDIAGVDRNALTVGVVVTPAELDRLKSMGWPVTMRASNARGTAVDALADYTDPAELSIFIDQVVAAHPDLAKKIVLKDSLWEAQKQYAVLITKDVTVGNERPSFILDAQHHAREVMTPEIARDMIDYLTSRYATDAQVRRWVDSINIYVVPSVNPDGAMAVFNGDNFWRKNRHPGCPVDNNRNYPALWGSCNGSSASCTDETTRGAFPASEPETQGLMQLTADVLPMFSLSYHSYGELIMYPYGCGDPNERAAFDEVGFGLRAILVNDQAFAGGYAVGPIWSTIYLVDGGSIDTQYNLFGVYGYTIEVNSGAQGFQPAYSPWRTLTVQRQRTAWTYLLDKTLDGPQIRMTVTDAGTGLPLRADVRLDEVTFTHGEAPRRADANGHHRFLVHSGATYHVSASYPAYCGATQAVAVGSGPANADIALVRPEVPQGVTAVAAGDNAIDVSWQPTAEADQYRVLRSLTAGGPYVAVATVPGSQTSFHDGGVSGVVTHHYVVRGIQGCESIDSTEAQASTTGFCSVGPSFAGASNVGNAATATCALAVTWPLAAARCGGAVTYNVYRSTTAPFAPAPANLVASGITGQTFVDHGALANEADYFYVVRAIDAHNNSDDGNTVAVTAFPTGPNVLGTWTDDAGDTGRAKLVTQPPWAVASTGGHGGPHAYATGIYPDNSCVDLTTPFITLSANSNLTFASKWDIESYYDAGIVEIESGGSRFAGWAKLPVLPYPDILYYEGNACNIPSNPPEPVFSRSNPSPDYTATPFRAKLAAYADQSIRLRWRLSSDGGVVGLGWWIDDIAITNAIIPGVCAAGTAPSPKEPSADGAMKASRSAATTVDVTYMPGCGALDNAVYWGTGPIVGSPVWTNAACAIGNSGHAIFDPGDPPPGGLLYFVIVGQNAASEGSYGLATSGERPEAVGVGACDKPQILTGTCP